MIIFILIMVFQYLISLNVRSLKKNIGSMTQLLHNVSLNFDVIAVTENWLDKHEVDCFNIEGYQVIHTIREYKKGGGCSIYISNSVKYKVVKNLCYTINDEIECACIELDMGKEKNVIVCCIYRAPGGSVDLFNEKFEDLLNKLCDNTKLVYICGDFNIDLLKCESHYTTQNFVDIIFGAGFYPLITKPSRITDTSATLIDNILINDLCRNNQSGLLISDISDHRPVFVCSEQHVSRNKRAVYKYKRVLNGNSISQLYMSLNNRDWSYVYQCKDVNEAYSYFIDLFKTDFNSCCPVKRIKVMESKKNKPWITKGLENACKKKSNLYKSFLRNRTTHSLFKYKLYKNKLTSVLRFAQKDYHDKLRRSCWCAKWIS